MNNFYNDYPPPGGPVYGTNWPPAPPPQWQPRSPKDPYRQLVRQSANRIGLCLLLFFVLSAIVSFAVMGAIGTLVGPVQYEIYYSRIYYLSSLAGYVCGFALPCLLLKVWIGIPARVAFPMRAPRAPLATQAVLLGMGACVAGMLLSGIVSVLLEMLFGVSPVGLSDLPLPEGALEIVLYVLMLAVAPAFLEELFFRGVIMQSLRRFGDTFALVVSSILFALTHGNLIQAPYALVLGLVMGFFVLRSGSLWTGILMHFVYNGLSIFMELLTQYMAPEQADIFSTGMLALYAILGLAALVVLLLRTPELLHLAPSRYPMPESKKYTAFLTTAAPIVFLLLSLLLTILDLE